MKIVLSLLITMLMINVYATRHYVNHDGTGEFSTIQAGINATINGDSVIVYPGIYYENIDYSGKSITVASLEAITGNPAYRDSTIIDGNRNGTCVRTSGTSTIFGFTIQNGSGWYNGNYSNGGGLFINNSQFKLYSCIIKNNRAFSGGGLLVANSTVQFKDTAIYNNYANGGGGIFFAEYANAVFDSVQRCSVYANYAGQGCDIIGVDTRSIIHIMLDMATLAYYDDYYQLYIKNISSLIGYFTYNILRGYRQEVNHDLYVATWGDDNNSGFTPQEPLKTITWALHKIAPDSLNPKTVYVAPGIYNADEGQIFPLSMKSHARLIGDVYNRPILLNSTFSPDIVCNNRQNAIIRYFFIAGTDTYKYTILSLMKNKDIEVSHIYINNVTNTYYGSSYYESRNLYMHNVNLNNIYAYRYPIFMGRINQSRIKNCSFNNCHSLISPGSSGAQLWETNTADSIYISNVSVTNCSSPDMAIAQIINWENCVTKIKLNNLLIANNSTTFTSAVVIKNMNGLGTLTNSSIVNNTAGNEAMTVSGKWNISNSIFSNNTPIEITIPMTVTYQTIINFKNNLIKNYPISVSTRPPSVANFVQGNFSANPSFAGTDVSNPLSYRLNYDSPCIDAGTPDTTGLNLPAFDLAGNPRIYNGVIDIGCYEWDSTSNPESNSPVINTETSISAYPNPFVDYVNISYSIPQKGKVGLDIYNLKGQKVKSLEYSEKAAGLHSILWNGKDSNGKPCASGVYYCRLQSGTSIVTRKMVLMK